MKKFFIITIILVASIFISTSYGCGDSQNGKISDNRYGIYSSFSDICYAEFTYGYREEPFLYNGISEKKVPFGVFLFDFKENLVENTIQIEIQYDEFQETLVLEKSPFDNTYGVDLEKIIKPEIIKIIFKGDVYQDEVITLQNQSNTWKIDNLKATQIAQKYFNEDLNRIKNYECYLKIISNHNFHQYFWYFSYLATNGERGQIIIDTQSGEILANS